MQTYEVNTKAVPLKRKLGGYTAARSIDVLLRYF
jgi:hypothetical protein